MMTGKTNEAVKCWKKAVELNPRSSSVQHLEHIKLQCLARNFFEKTNVFGSFSSQPKNVKKSEKQKLQGDKAKQGPFNKALVVGKLM